MMDREGREGGREGEGDVEAFIYIDRMRRKSARRN